MASQGPKWYICAKVEYSLYLYNRSVTVTILSTAAGCFPPPSTTEASPPNKTAVSMNSQTVVIIASITAVIFLVICIVLATVFTVRWVCSTTCTHLCPTFFQVYFLLHLFAINWRLKGSFSSPSELKAENSFFYQSCPSFVCPSVCPSFCKFVNIFVFSKTNGQKTLQ